MADNSSVDETALAIAQQQIEKLLAMVDEKDRLLAAATASEQDARNRVGELQKLEAEKDRAIAALRVEKAQGIQELRRTLEQKDQHIQSLYFQLAAIQSSLSFKLITRLNRCRESIIPENTWRYHLYRQLVKTGHIISDEGFHNVLRRGWRYIKKGGLRSISAEYDFNQSYQRWIDKHEPNPDELAADQEEAQSFTYQPLISIVMPVYNVDEVWLRAAIESVRNQTYGRWELCIADDASTKPHIKTVLTEYADRDKRIRVVFLEDNQGISGASDAALNLATGEFAGLLDHDDELASFALFEVVKLLNHEPGLDLIYSDEDKLEPDGRRVDAFFKPDFSPDLLMSMNYISHFSVYRRQVLHEVGGFRKGFEGSQDHDLVLRTTEYTKRIAHVPKILYHWRKISGSSSTGTATKNFAYEAGIRALEDALLRRNQQGQVKMLFESHYRVIYQVEDMPRVSIIIPTKDKAVLLRRCVESIRGKSTYSNYELIIVDNNSTEETTMAYLKRLGSYPDCRVLKFDEPFNYCRINNYAVTEARGDLLLFLNNDTEVITPGWMEEMVSHAQHQETGAVGVKLLFPDKLIQHGGVIIGLGGFAAHAFYRLPAECYGYMALAQVTRNVSAVTAACLMMRREVFEEVGGLDDNLDVAYNDIDMCLKIIDHGYNIVWTPHALLYHHESASRGLCHPEDNMQYFCGKWKRYLEDGDPFYNKNLSLRNSYALEC
jgi:glycosyltransferase involved in cell wall biosynthesis